MSQDPLDRLRRQNPVQGPMAELPIDTVLNRIAESEGSEERGRSASSNEPARAWRPFVRITPGRLAGSLTGLAAAAVVALSATLGTVASVADQTPARGAMLTIAEVAPFTGTDGALGAEYQVACEGAATAIDQAGGVLGHALNCKAVDTRGDPADAVESVREMYAGTPDLAFVIGCTSDEADSVVPLFNANRTVSFCMTGQSEFDHLKLPYFYRLVPPDRTESYAMTAIAQNHHYTRVALAFGNDTGSQTFVGPAVAAIQDAGMKVVDNELLDLSATNFLPEAESLVASKPQVILTEALGHTEATFLREVKQLNGGKMIPVIGTAATVLPNWFKSASAAIGSRVLAGNYLADNFYTQTRGPAFRAFKTALYDARKLTKIGDFSTYLTAPGAVHLYDGINLAALAMLEARSVKSSVWAPYVKRICNGVPGSKLVTSFAQGAAAIKHGTPIRYVGPGGAESFDAYHNAAAAFQVDSYTATGSVKVVGTLPAREMRWLGLTATG